MGLLGNYHHFRVHPHMEKLMKIGETHHWTIHLKFPMLQRTGFPEVVSIRRKVEMLVEKLTLHGKKSMENRKFGNAMQI